MSAGADGYRRRPSGGPVVRTDIVDVYLFRDAGAAGGIELLQLLRVGEPLGGTWQPIMGHIEPGEAAPATALRELREEVGLEKDDPSVLGIWALEQVHPFYLAALDCIVMSPRFGVLVRSGWEPVLNAEHSAFRWTARDEDFMWPGQRGSIEEIRRYLAVPSDARERLRIR